MGDSMVWSSMKCSMVYRGCMMDRGMVYKWCSMVNRGSMEGCMVYRGGMESCVVYRGTEDSVVNGGSVKGVGGNSDIAFGTKGFMGVLVG